MPKFFWFRTCNDRTVNFSFCVIFTNGTQSGSLALLWYDGFCDDLPLFVLHVLQAVCTYPPTCRG